MRVQVVVEVAVVVRSWTRARGLFLSRDSSRRGRPRREGETDSANELKCKVPN